MIPPDDAAFINNRILEMYLFNWMVDGLPAAQKSDTGMESATPGFHLGQIIAPTKNNNVVPNILLNNHFEIYIMYHTTNSPDKHRVVGVYVNPSSTASLTCDRVENDQGMILSDSHDNKVSYTYDVYWIVWNFELEKSN